jgi:hypothetical protein
MRTIGNSEKARDFSTCQGSIASQSKEQVVEEIVGFMTFDGSASVGVIDSHEFVNVQK